MTTTEPVRVTRIEVSTDIADHVERIRRIRADFTEFAGTVIMSYPDNPGTDRAVGRIRDAALEFEQYELELLRAAIL